MCLNKITNRNPGIQDLLDAGFKAEVDKRGKNWLIGYRTRVTGLGHKDYEVGKSYNQIDYTKEFIRDTLVAEENYSVEEAENIMEAIYHHTNLIESGALRTDSGELHYGGFFVFANLDQCKAWGEGMQELVKVHIWPSHVHTLGTQVWNDDKGHMHDAVVCVTTEMRVVESVFKPDVGTLSEEDV